jgi:hypothetical protein
MKILNNDDFLMRIFRIPACRGKCYPLGAASQELPGTSAGNAKGSM